MEPPELDAVQQKLKQQQLLLSERAELLQGRVEQLRAVRAQLTAADVQMPPHLSRELQQVRVGHPEEARLQG